MNPPTLNDLSRGLEETSMKMKRLPVRKRVSLPSLFRILSKMREERGTQPSLTKADSMSAPSQEIGMSEIHIFVDGVSLPSCPFKIKGILSESKRDLAMLYLLSTAGPVPGVTEGRSTITSVFLGLQQLSLSHTPFQRPNIFLMLL